MGRQEGFQVMELKNDLWSEIRKVFGNAQILERWMGWYDREMSKGENQNLQYMAMPSKFSYCLA